MKQIIVDYDKLCGFIEMLDGGTISDDERMEALIEYTDAIVVENEGERSYE